MKTFKEILQEGISPEITKNHVDINHPSTRKEINRNLAIKFSKHYTNIFDAWIALRRILDLYHIPLPTTHLQNDTHGEEVIPVTQFGSVQGTDMYGNTNNDIEPDHKYFIQFKYVVDDTNFYKCSAILFTEDELKQQSEKPSMLGIVIHKA